MELSTLDTIQGMLERGEMPFQVKADSEQKQLHAEKIAKEELEQECQEPGRISSTLGDHRRRPRFRLLRQDGRAEGQGQGASPLEARRRSVRGRLRRPASRDRDGGKTPCLGREVGGIAYHAGADIPACLRNVGSWLSVAPGPHPLTPLPKGCTLLKPGERIDLG